MPPSIQKVTTAIKEVLPQYGEVLFAYLFGSYARGDMGPLSDVDIALYVDISVSKENRRMLAMDIAELIVKRLRLVGEYPVQIQVLNNLYEKSIALEQEIVYNGMVIYTKDDGARAHYEACAIHRVCDWLPHQEKFNKATLAYIDKPIEPYKVYAK